VFDELDNLADMVSKSTLADFVYVPLEDEGTAVINTLTDAQKATLMPLLEKKERADVKKAQRATVNKMCNAIARRLIVAGVRSEELRRQAYLYHHSKPIMKDFLSAVHQVAENMDSKSGTGFNAFNKSYNSAKNNKQKNTTTNKKNSTGGAFEVTDQATTNVQEDGGEASAATAARRQGGQAGQGTQSARGGRRNQNQRVFKPCAFCGRTNHLEQNCFAKAANERYARAAAGKPTASAADGEAPAEESNAKICTASGNALVGW
jgi:hypothetical protein